MTPLTARALALKAIADGDVHHSRRGDSDDDEDWRSARSAQTNRSFVSAKSKDGSVVSADLNNFSFRDDIQLSTARVQHNGNVLSSTTDRSHPLHPLTRQQPSPVTRVDTSDTVVSVDETNGNAATADAFRALELATAGIESDALDKLVEDSDNVGIEGPNGTMMNGGATSTGTSTGDRTTQKNPNKKSGNFLSRRLGKVGEGMRMLNAVRSALRKAGGVLDLTSFAGTPIKWHAPHSALLAHCRGRSALGRLVRVGDVAAATMKGRPTTLAVTTCPDGSSPTLTDVEAHDKTWITKRPPRAHRLFTSLRDSFGERLAVDDTEVGLTVKQKEIATLSPFDVTTPTGRILHVLAAVLADCEPPAHLQKPFNPVLGETARHELQFTDGSSVKSILEQTSHHPPITAFFSQHSDESFSVVGHFCPRPKLKKLGRVDVDIEGVRVFEVRVDAESKSTQVDAATSTPGSSGLTKCPYEKYSYEKYVSNFVGFEWHFFPTMRAKVQTGMPHFIRCTETQLVVQVEHVKGSKKGYGVVGSVRRLSSDGVAATGDPLFTIAGSIDGRVVATDVTSKESFILYDADVAAMHEASHVTHDCAFDLLHDSKGTSVVWGSVVSAMSASPPKWDDAREGKKKVERSERRVRAQRVKNRNPFTPKFFEPDEASKTWQLRREVIQKGEEPRGAPERG